MGCNGARTDGRAQITIGSYPVWISTILMLAMVGVYWWAFAYRREGFMPQMYGSVRACCAATTQLDDFPVEGIQWGDCESCVFLCTFCADEWPCSGREWPVSLRRLLVPGG